LDFVFVFGWFNLPKMGTIGLAYSTLAARTILGLVLLGFCLKFIRVRKYRDYGYYLNLLKIGFPIALAIVTEVFAFNLITILIGRISGVYAAAQNILLTLTTATFMIPMAISNAIAVKVGFANGAGNIVDMKRYSYAGVGVSVGFMSFCAVCFLTMPNLFINIFTSDATLVKICAPILVLAGLFQIFDGMQVSLGGVFKGLKKTNIIMLGDFAAYWLVGLPVGIWLAFSRGMELFGFWIGLTVAIFILAIFFLSALVLYFTKNTKKNI
jgi:MATE family multidrug resistance protein